MKGYIGQLKPKEMIDIVCDGLTIWDLNNTGKMVGIPLNRSHLTITLNEHWIPGNTAREYDIEVYSDNGLNKKRAMIHRLGPDDWGYIGVQTVYNQLTDKFEEKYRSPKDRVPDPTRRTLDQTIWDQLIQTGVV